MAAMRITVRMEIAASIEFFSGLFFLSHYQVGGLAGRLCSYSLIIRLYLYPRASPGDVPLRTEHCAGFPG